MNMVKMSSQDAAEHLGVSEARVRQRIAEGSLVAEKIGGRWLVDLDPAAGGRSHPGRPASSASVWRSLLAVEIASAARFRGDDDGGDRVNDRGLSACSLLPQPPQALAAAITRSWPEDSPRRDCDARPDDSEWGLLPRLRAADRLVEHVEAIGSRDDGHRSARFSDRWDEAFSASLKMVSVSSRRRALLRIAQGIEQRDHVRLLHWLRSRASRQVLVIAGNDANALREDARLLPSGLSHPDSHMVDPRVVEGYVSEQDAPALVADYWLDPPRLDQQPNVILHVAPVRPARVSPLLLAADLAEHHGPREKRRAQELLDEAISLILSDDSPDHDDSEGGQR